MKKTLSIILAVAMVMALCVGLAGCGEKGPKVVAEGVGYSAWGYDMNILYQEYSDGSVKVYMACTMEDQPSVQVIFDGTVAKGKDADGDPLVTLSISGATMAADLEGTGTVEEQDGSAWIDETEIETNSYDASTGAYTIPFEYSLYGYTPITVSIDVAKTSSATDSAAFLAEYLG